MFHLSVGGLCSYACTLESFAAKMFHLTAATCQDVPSFGRGLCSYACTLESFAAKMFHLKAATCQDVPSFGRGTL